jgi:hypothetical protein
MPLPANFHFSQASLTDYLDYECFECAICWSKPGLPSSLSPCWNGYAELGRVSKLIQQHVAGLPEEVLAPSASEPELTRWWQACLQSPPRHYDLPAPRRAGVALDSNRATSLRGVSPAPRRCASDRAPHATT